MITRPSRPSGRVAMEAQGGKVEFIDEKINDTDKVIFADPVLQTLGKKRRLIPVHALDETRHADPPTPCQSLPQQREFPHSLGSYPELAA